MSWLQNITANGTTTAKAIGRGKKTAHASGTFDSADITLEWMPADANGDPDTAKAVAVGALTTNIVAEGMFAIDALPGGGFIHAVTVSVVTAADVDILIGNTDHQPA